MDLMQRAAFLTVIGRLGGLTTYETKRGEMEVAQFLMHNARGGLGETLNVALNDGWPRMGMSEGQPMALPVTISVANGRKYLRVMDPTVNKVLDFQKLASLAADLQEEARTGQTSLTTA